MSYCLAAGFKVKVSQKILEQRHVILNCPLKILIACFAAWFICCLLFVVVLGALRQFSTGTNILTDPGNLAGQAAQAAESPDPTALVQPVLEQRLLVSNASQNQATNLPRTSSNLNTLSLLLQSPHHNPHQWDSFIWCLMHMIFYNIPRAWLLNRSPVPVMVLKSNRQACLWSKSDRSGLWRHIISTCRRLRWLCCKHSNNVARRDKTPVKSTLFARNKSSVAP